MQQGDLKQYSIQVQFILKMATLQALAISGIRGYNPEKLERIDFTCPITLINGKNGSGKTTIIQCLKYITTGVLPPSAKTQKSFVMDPSIAGTPEVRGDIRLRFRTAKNRVVIAKKIICCSKTQKGLSLRAVEQSLKTKDDDGKQIQVTQKCADIQKQIPQMLGISRAILDNIVFCHQDQSLWPFSDNNTLKGIFDQLFDTKRFTKAMDNMKDALKDYEKEKTQIKGQLQYLKTAYLRMVDHRTQNLLGLVQVVQASQQLMEVKKQLDPLRQKIKQISSKQSTKNDLISSKGVIQYKIIDLNEKISKIQSKMDKQIIAKKFLEQQQRKKIISKLVEQIQKKEKEIKYLQHLAQQIKDKQATQKRKIQFHMQVKRIKQILPSINNVSPATAQQILKHMGQKLQQMRKNKKELSYLKQKLSQLIIPSVPTQFEKQQTKFQQQKLIKIKQEMQGVQKKIRTIYNKLYDGTVKQHYSNISNESKNAGQKLSRLQAQIQLKKNQLRKYQQMKPRDKSLQQQIYQIKYTGIELQKQMFQFIKRKKQCMLCMKKLNDSDMEDIKTKINKTIKKSQARIQQLKRNYKPNEDIDPAPIIKQIQNFIDHTNRTMRGLAEEKQEYDRFVTEHHQIQLNKQLNRLMQGIQLKSSNFKTEQIILNNRQFTIQRFRQLINQYKMAALTYKNLIIESSRSKERMQRIEQIKRNHSVQTQLKKQLQAKIIKLQVEVKNLDIIQNIYSKINELNSLIKRDDEKGLNSQQSSSQLINKIQVMENELREKQIQKQNYQLLTQLAGYQKDRKLLKQKLSQLIQQLRQISQKKNRTSELENKKSSLQIQQAKLSQKIRLKRSIHSKMIEQTPPYLMKILRFNAVSSMITDINTSVKAMERAINRVHNQKMDQINKILFDIWQEVYHAKDIQFIKINSISQKKNGYGYSIMMKKNGQLIQMKGRCSMGQKVLASLIIRMALAEAFSASSHILALDQPTTNLDRVHIQNLAESISNILQMQQNSRFQLIIISHDMQFISLLKKHTNFYYEISRNQRNFSSIVRKEISQLSNQSTIPRLEAIHY